MRIFVNHYHCENEIVTTWKDSKYACSIKKNDLQDIYNQVSKYFDDENVNRDNLGSFYLDKDKNVVVVELIDNSQEEQENFLKQVNLNSKYIEFEQGGPYTTLATDFYVTKPEVHNDIKFKICYENNNRRVYLAGNLGEFYLKEEDGDITLKTYLSTAFQTFDDGIKSITDELDVVDTYRDGGTTVYKSIDKDITVIVCNKIDGNKNVYIGDYYLEYSDDLCN